MTYAWKQTNSMLEHSDYCRGLQFRKTEDWSYTHCLP